MKKKIMLLLIFVLIFTNTFSILAFLNIKKDFENEKSKLLELNNKLENIESKKSEKLFQRNSLDQIARELFEAFEIRDINVIKQYLSTTAEIDETKILFVDSQGQYQFDYIDSTMNYELRQRYFEFIDDNEYITAYEMESDKKDSFSVINFVFKKENLDWKLTGLYFE